MWKYIDSKRLGERQEASEGKNMSLPASVPNSFPIPAVPFETVQVVRAAGDILQAAEQIFSEVRSSR